MDDIIIIASIVLRLIGVGYSLWLLYLVKDGRFAFLTVMLSLMATRQILTLGSGSPGIDELPGLVVSVFAVLTVYYLAQYTEQEAEIKERIQAKNEQLRTFKKAIEHAGHGIFITDPDGTITYANQAVEEVTGYPKDEVLGENPSMWKSGYHDEAFYEEMWETIEAGEVWDGQIVNERKDGDRVWVDMTIAPIVSDDDVEKFVAVDNDITEQKERKRRITEQKDRLAVLNRTNEVLRDINRELVEAGSRTEIEEAVIHRFARSSQYDFAWISAQTLTTETVRPRTWAGIQESTLDEMVYSLNDPSAVDPVTEAIDSGTVQICTCDGSTDPWIRPLRNHDYHALGVVPLSYGDTSYGTLCIGTRHADAFEDIEKTVFQELGETIGYAINAAESKAALLTDSVTEVEFTSRDRTCYPVALTDELEGEFELEWTTPSSEGAIIEYVTIRDVDPDAVIEFADSSPALGGVRLVTTDETEALFRFEVTDSLVAEPLGEYGADCKAITASDGRARITAHLSRNADVRAFLAALKAKHDDVELLARRETERPAVTTQEISSAIEEQLTDRQREALQTAFVGGFFEWPRRSSGEEIANIMGINQSTFLQHLRAAERKLLGVLIETEKTVQPGSI